MTINQALVIESTGLVRGGNITISADTESGSVNYNGTVTVGSWLFHKVMPFSGSYKLDPQYLQSATYVPEKTLEIDGFSGEVVSVLNKMADLDLIFVKNDIDVKGTAILDISGQYINITSVDMSGRAQGLQGHVVLTKTPLKTKKQSLLSKILNKILGVK